MDGLKQKARVAVLIFVGVFLLNTFSFTGVEMFYAEESTKASEEANRDKPTIYTVSTSHLDTVWDWTFEESIQQYLKPTFVDNMRLMDKYPEYVFSFESAFHYMLLKEYYPEVNEDLKNYIDEGRWKVAGSSLVAGDVNVPSPESLSRQYLYGNNFFMDEYGVKSTDVYLPDCFGFGYALPTVARHMGLNSFMTQKLTWGSSVGIPFDIGKWIGVDGSYLISSLNPGSYVTTFNSPVYNDGNITNRARRSPIDTAVQLYGVGDRGGAPTEQTVRNVLNSAKNGKYNFVSAYTSQYADELTQAEIEQLPEYDGEMLMTNHGAGSYSSVALTKRFNRQNELLASAAEQANVAAAWLGTTEYPQQRLNEAWVRFLWHQFHDDITGTSLSEVYTSTYNDLILSLNQFSQEYTNGVESFINGMDTRVDDGVAVVVHNSADADRKDLVETTVRFDSEPKNVKVYDTGGNEVPSQIISKNENEVEVAFLGEVSANGYKVYNIVPSRKPCKIDTGLSVSKDTIQNKIYRVKINDNGDIYSIVDKVNSREMLNEPIELQLITTEPRDWPAWEVGYEDVMREPRAIVSGKPEIKILSDGPAKVSLGIKRNFNSSTFTQIITLYAGDEGKRVEVDNQVNWAERATLLKASFPFSVANEEATYDLGIGTINRKNNSSKLFEVPAQQWADISDDGYGVTVMSDSKYGWDKPADNVLRLTLIHTPASDRAMAHQDVMDFGDNRFKYAIMGHTDDWKNGSQQEAEKFNRPMVAFQTEEHDGQLGKDYSFASLDTDQVSIEAIKKAEYSDEIIVRVYENYGQSANNVCLTMANGIKSAREVNGAEDEIDTANSASLEVRDGKVYFSTEGNNIKSFAITLESPEESLSPENQTQIDLDFNKDVVTFQGNKDGEFVHSGYSIPGELFPRSILSGGVKYNFGSSNENEKNAVECSGQTISIPEGFNSAHILATSINGDKEATFDVGGAQQSVSAQDYRENIGGWDQYGLDHYGFIKRDNVAYTATHTHRSGRDSVYDNIYLYEYELDIPEGANSIKLPDDTDIIVMAITLSDSVKSAVGSELYDVKNKSETYTLTVKNGQGSGSYPAGVPVKAYVEPAETGVVSWKGYDAIEGKNTSIIEFIMPAEDITVEANIQSYGPNLALNKPVVVSAENGSEKGENMVDGSINGVGDKWCSIEAWPQWAYVDLGSSQTINRWVVKHAGAAGESSGYNTSDFVLQISDNAKDWTTVDTVKNNKANITDRKVDDFTARYVRLFIQKGESSGNGATRIFALELYNTDVDNPQFADNGSSQLSNNKISYKPLSGDYRVVIVDEGDFNWIPIAIVAAAVLVVAAIGLGLVAVRRRQGKS